MVAVFHIAIFILSLISRSAFFWVWNFCILLLILSLHYVTFFDFDGGTLVLELFFTTLVLSGAVNAFVFHLGTVKDLSRKQWDLLIIRPIKPIQLIAGNFFGLISFQIFINLLLTGLFLFESYFFLERTFGSSFWLSWIFATLQIAMLTALFGFIVIWLSTFWASVAMVGAFLLGHLSQYIQHVLPEGTSPLTALVFCLVPDLGISFPLQVGGDVPDKLAPFILYSLSYLVLILYASKLSLRPSLARR